VARWWLSSFPWRKKFYFGEFYANYWEQEIQICTSLGVGWRR